MSMSMSMLQVARLKAIVEMHSLLGKLTEGFAKNHCNQRSTADRMKLQLTNAAGSLVQMLREEAQYDAAVDGGAAAERHEGTLFDARAERLRQALIEGGAQGYELDLLSTLQQLIRQAADERSGEDIGWQHGAQPPSPAAAESSSSPIESLSNNMSMSNSSTAPQYQLAASAGGKLDMHAESTACLAASNPVVLPHLPAVFEKSIGVETCVWFNSFSGRLYRDIAHSRFALTLCMQQQ